MYRERYRDADVSSTSSARRWSPAQLLGIAIAIFMLVLGGVVLNNTGINLPGKHVIIAGLPHNALLGLLELVFSLILLAFAAVPGGDRTGLTVMGVLLFAVGMMILVDPNNFYSSLGSRQSNGVLFLLLGALLAGLSFFGPTFSRTRRTVASDVVSEGSMRGRRRRVVEQPMVEQPMVQQPMVQQPMVQQQPIVQQQPVVEEYIDDDPLI